MRSTADERSQATRGRIVDAARELIAEEGYEGFSIAGVLRRANVSRGGLYHHFAGKQELIAAVLENVERELVERLAQLRGDGADAMEAIEVGSQAFLDECVRSRELQRIGLVEGRKALGWEAWREVVSPFGISMLAQTFAAAMDEGTLQPSDPLVLAHVVLAALHEASALIAAAEDQQHARERTGQAIAQVLGGLRRR